MPLAQKCIHSTLEVPNDSSYCYIVVDTDNRNGSIGCSEFGLPSTQNCPSTQFFPVAGSICLCCSEPQQVDLSFHVIHVTGLGPFHEVNHVFTPPVSDLRCQVAVSNSSINSCRCVTIPSRAALSETLGESGILGASPVRRRTAGLVWSGRRGRGRPKGQAFEFWGAQGEVFGVAVRHIMWFK